MEPCRPQPDGEEEEWKKWRAERARRREEMARQESAIQEQLRASNGAAINCLLYVIIAIGVVNFTIFEATAGFAGGRAAIGKIERGRFYVGNHGSYTEVSEAFFDYSRIHGYSIWVTHPATMGSMVLLGLRKAKAEKRRQRLLRRLNQHLK